MRISLYKVTIGYKPTADPEAMEHYVQHNSIDTLRNCEEDLLKQTQDFFLSSIVEVSFDTFEPIEAKENSSPDCETCGDRCDFGQRGDGPAQQDPETGKCYCDTECYGLALIKLRQAGEI